MTGQEDRASANPPQRRWPRRLAWATVALFTSLAAACLAGWILLPGIDLGPLAASRMSARLARAVAIGALHVTPGRWVRIELQGARIDNLPGGTRATMIDVAAGSAEINLASLLRGSLVVRHLSLDGLDVLLEHVADQGPNWRFAAHPSPPEPRPTRWFPTLTDARVVGDIVVRTSNGQTLPLQLDGVSLSATAPDQPIHLAGPGSYRGVPLTLNSTLGSILQFRDGTKPFPADLTLVSGETRLRFAGTMTDPLALDGAKGRMTLEAPTPAVLYRIGGVESGFDPSLELTGELEHAGRMWQLTGTKGALGQSPFQGGRLRLDEGECCGPGKQPDRLAVALDFERLDLDRLLAERGSRGSDLSLRVDPAPGTLITAALTAGTMTYNGIRLADIRFEAAQQPGRVTVDALAASYLGGRLGARGEIDAVPEGGRVSGEVDAVGMEIQALRALLDMGRLPVAGRIDAKIVVAATGPTLNQAARGMRASAVMTMAGGSIAKEVIEMASTDARALFRTARGTAAVSCMLGVLDVRAGVGTVAPIRVRTAEGTIAGHGTIDLVRRRLDLTVASEAATTGAFALDVPVRVSGSFNDPAYAPARLSPAGRAQLAAGDEVGRLVPALQGMARSSPCLGRR